MTALLPRSVALALASAAALMTVTAPSGASPKETATLTYAPAASCPDEAAFRRKVAARLGYDPFVAAASRSIDVSFTTSGRTVTATTRLRVLGASESVRKLDQAADQCEPLAEAVAASVATVIDPAHASAPVPPPAPPVPTSDAVIIQVPAKVASSPPSPRVHLDADDGAAVLEQRRGTDFIVLGVGTFPSVLTKGRWFPTCQAPCDLQVNSNFTYRVSGPGITSSEEFVLPEGSDVAVTAKTGSWWGYFGGQVASGVGAGVSVLGGTLLILGLTATTTSDSCSVDNAGMRHCTTVTDPAQVALNKKDTVAGALVLGAGLTLGVTGIIVSLASRTKVTVAPTKSATGRTIAVDAAGIHF